MLHLHARFEMILARRHDRRLSDALPAAEPGQRRIRQRRAGRRQFLMDSHEIPLAGDQKIEDLLPVGFGFLRPLDFRNVGGVRTQDFAHAQARQPQHARDLAFAHSLRAQFQNRGALRLAQHVWLPAPFRFVPPSGGVPGARFQSGPALVSVAGPSSPGGLQRASCRHDAGWPAPSPDRAPLVRPPPAGLPDGCRCVFKNSSGSARMRSRTARVALRQAV